MADNSHEKSEALEAEAVFFAEGAGEDVGSAPPTVMGALPTRWYHQASRPPHFLEGPQ